MTSPAAFWQARLAEDDAEAASPGGPAALRERQRREAAAKRAVLEWYSLDFGADGKPVFEGDRGELYWDVARAVMTVWDDHPDYSPAWKP